MKNPNDKREEQRYMVVKHQAVFDRYVNSLQVLARSAPADKHLLVTGLMERRQARARALSVCARQSAGVLTQWRCRSMCRWWR